jgi:hypothetical protein
VIKRADTETQVVGGQRIYVNSEIGFRRLVVTLSGLRQIVADYPDLPAAIRAAMLALLDTLKPAPAG